MKTANQKRIYLPHPLKIEMTKKRIREWYYHFDGEVYVAFSGGRDSTILLHLVRSLFPEVPGVFNDTGLEYPENREFVKTFDNMIWLRPKKNFKQVIEQYGYPIISKEVSQYVHELRTTKSEYMMNKRLHGDEKGHGRLAQKWHKLVYAPFKISHSCCYWLKKEPAKRYEKETGKVPFLGFTFDESGQRIQSYNKYGCNAYELRRPASRPMMFWTRKDVDQFIRDNKLKISTAYDILGITRTGCMFCAFGVHLSRPNKFQIMKRTHPKQWSYCLDKLGMRDVLDYLGIPYDDDYLF